MTNKINIASYVLNIILIGGIIYSLFFYNVSTDDVKTYQEKIDSLNVLIENNKLKLDSLSTIETKNEERISNLKSELSSVSNKNKLLKKKYDEEINTIHNMSNTDITNTFAEQFK